MRILATMALAIMALPADSRRVAVGDWGGEHVRLSVQEGRASIVFDCAHGTIEHRMDLDENGRFDVEGEFVREHGGPVRKDEVEDSQKVRYQGSVEDRSMTLSVVFADGQSAGPFRLGLGSAGRIVRCN